jgi:DNA invertase Pin-like site-specific DNA recombinase
MPSFQKLNSPIRFIAVKEGIRLNGSQDMQTKVMVTMFSLFAEIERDLISMRTKEGLAAARASGKKLGRPKGALGKLKLGGREDEIRRFLALDISKASIAKITGVDRSTLYNFIRSRGLVSNS